VLYFAATKSSVSHCKYGTNCLVLILDWKWTTGTLSSNHYPQFHGFIKHEHVNERVSPWGHVCQRKKGWVVICINFLCGGTLCLWFRSGKCFGVFTRHVFSEINEDSVWDRALNWEMFLGTRIGPEDICGMEFINLWKYIFILVTKSYLYFSRLIDC